MNSHEHYGGDNTGEEDPLYLLSVRCTPPSQSERQRWRSGRIRLCTSWVRAACRGHNRERGQEAERNGKEKLAPIPESDLELVKLVRLDGVAANTLLSSYRLGDTREILEL
jgi:hypothetical protein